MIFIMLSRYRLCTRTFQAGTRYVPTRLFSDKPNNHVPSIRDRANPAIGDVHKSKPNAVNLGHYMNRVYTKTAMYLGVSAVTATASAGLFMFDPGFGSVAALTGGVGGLAGAFLFGDNPPKVTYSKSGKVVAEKYTTRQMTCAQAIAVGMGALMGPALMTTAATAPEAIPLAALATAGTMGGMIHYARTVRQGKLVKYGPVLYTALWGLVISDFSVMIYEYFNGVPVNYWIAESFVGVGLFSAITAYDYQQTVKDFNDGKPNSLSHAINFHLNAINLFIRLLKIIRGDR